ncbi:enterochelin esterase [Corynebacterium uropygiale]|uniref:Enterochelin esterase n=1 Tax=Corynebacterium uropygiale TaxID=1775911 RepID=A0A9X1QTA1_9CORY|nr:enterochelin esterase domain-containing protein [Corynebacterium uropygiale]MCF4007363.1 enterochelin esterase [Corynebacterium uropygiale]
MTEIPLSYTPSPGEPEPARVYVHVAAVHNHHAEELHHMSRLPDGSYHASFSVPDDVCTSYLIAPVDEDFLTRFDPPGPVDTRARWLALLERALPGPPALRGETGRIRGPRALPEPEWDDLSPTPEEWEPVSIDSPSPRRVWRARTGPAPEFLLLLFDATFWLRTPLPRALRAAGLPPLEILAVDTGDGEERFEVMGRTPELPRFLHEDLLPRTPWTPARTIVCGQSLGGLAALSIGAGRPRIADLVLSQSGSFWFPAWGGEDGGELAAELRDPQVIARLRERGVRAHFSVGLAEADMVPHTRAVVDALEAAGVPTSLEVSRHGHEMAGWMGALSRGLRQLLR